MFSLWQLRLTTTNLSYRFSIFETSATASCGSSMTYFMLILNNPCTVSGCFFFFFSDSGGCLVCSTNQDTGTLWSQSSTLVAHVGSRWWWAQVVLYSYILEADCRSRGEFSPIFANGKTKRPGIPKAKGGMYLEERQETGILEAWHISNQEWLYRNYKFRIYLGKRQQEFGRLERRLHYEPTPTLWKHPSMLPKHTTPGQTAQLTMACITFRRWQGWDLYIFSESSYISYMGVSKNRGIPKMDGL